ncbi:MAG: PLP-dependent aspartate aminotransferase family protein [Steroidobacteraceae bacterium]
MKRETLLNHPPRADVPADNRSVVAPIYQSVKFELPTVEDTLGALRGERPGFFYQRTSNPTLRSLELLLAEMQGREDCLVSASGVSAVAQCLLALTRAGDHILCFVETYGPTRQIIRGLLARFGVTHTMVSIEDHAAIERVLASQRTRLMLFESPTNPINKIADIEFLTATARRFDALTVMDNTFAGIHQHGQYDVDFFLHSLTKYASGAGDVMGGATIANRELLAPLRRDYSLIGGVLDPHAAFLIQRGLATYLHRYRAQSASAQAVAEFLESQPQVARVHYPGLASHRRSELARKQMQEFGGVVSFDLAAGAEAGRRFTEALQLFALTASLGSTESLVMAPQLMRPREFSPEQLAASGIADGTVRLSIGLENIEDLLADIRQALAA